MNVRKLDGRTEVFDEHKIVTGLLKAWDGLKNDTIKREMVEETFRSIASSISKELESKEEVSAEDLASMVISRLKDKCFSPLVKAYKRCRKSRDDFREAKTKLMSDISEITFADAKDADQKRDNANIDGNTSMGTMLEYGSTISRDFCKKNVMSPEFAEAHDNGDIHIHDMDFMNMGTLTCCQIDLRKLFKGGFSTGHGHLREPQDIMSYAALAAIAIQSDQNDQHGGQSVPFFDYCMAPGVKKTFRKHYIANLKKAYRLFLDTQANFVDDCVKESEVISPVAITDNDDRVKKERELLLASSEGFDEGNIAYIQKFAHDEALAETERKTYQAMEGIIHNLNTMHCLPASEKLWVYDKLNDTFDLIAIGDLEEQFVKGRYAVLSLNPVSFKTELKDITHVTKNSSHRRLITLGMKNGGQVRTTDNHEILTLNGLDLITNIPEELTTTLSPRKFELPAFTGDIKVCESEVYKTTPYKADSFPVTEALAELFGYYAADGEVSATSSIDFIASDYDDVDRLLFLMEQAFGTEFTYTEDPDLGLRFNVGTRLASTFKRECGDNAFTKHIPQCILRGSEQIKKTFLKAYFTYHNSSTRYVESTCASKRFIDELGLMVMSLGELPVFSQEDCGDGHKCYSIFLGNLPCQRLGIPLNKTASVEGQNYDLSALVPVFRGHGLTWDKLPYKARRPVAPNMTIAQAEGVIKDNGIKDEAFKLLNVFNVPVTDKCESDSGEEYVYDLGVQDNENFLTESGIFVHNSRAGAQVPFSSLNFGTDTSVEGRMVTKNLLLACEAGLGNGETSIFPILIFKVKEGINFNPEDPNYDLLKLSCRVTSKRLFPNFEFLDAPFNAQYLKKLPDGSYDPDTEVATMGCRTRVMGNVCGSETASGRGNDSFTSINLPRLGILHGIVNGGEADWNGFYEDLDRLLDLCIRQLLERFKVQGSKKVKNFPFLMGQGIWNGSSELEPEDTLEEVVKQGTLTVGFIGLAETLVAMTGHHHGESDECQKLGLEIVGHMRDKVNEATKKYHLNFSLIATPAEGLSGRFVRIDAKRFGVIPGVTDREYYTNSFHVPVYFPISIFGKLEKEAPYHALTNGGHISYVELDGNAQNNPEAFMTIVRGMKELGIGYGSVNHPVDRCPVCGYTGIIGEECPRCHVKEGQEITLEEKRNIWKKFN